jgi:hypothetical protein
MKRLLLSIFAVLFLTTATGWADTLSTADIADAAYKRDDHKEAVK